MQFEKHIIDHRECYISGRYKIVPMEMLKYGNAVRWFSYFKPTGWVNWGNRVNPAVECYETMEAAVAACVAHAEPPCAQ